MKLQLQQDQSKKETEIQITYPRMDERLNRMIHEIRQYEHTISGKVDGAIFEIPLERIVYFDCIDGKTFFYTKDETFESQENLIGLEKELEATSVVRIQKNCLMNTNYLRSVRPYPNHRLLAEMNNGEKLIISRKYISELKNIGKRRVI